MEMSVSFFIEDYKFILTKIGKVYILDIYNNQPLIVDSAQSAKARKGIIMDIIISNSSGVPIYEQIEEQIKSQIMTGELLEGDALPSMRVLAKELKISIITTKRAYEDLERDGFIESVTGKGSFVKGINNDIVRENMMYAIQELIESAVDKAILGKVSLEEIQEMVELLYQEKNN